MRTPETYSQFTARMKRDDLRRDENLRNYNAQTYLDDSASRRRTRQHKIGGAVAIVMLLVLAYLTWQFVMPNTEGVAGLWAK